MAAALCRRPQAQQATDPRLTGSTPSAPSTPRRLFVPKGLLHAAAGPHLAQGRAAQGERGIQECSLIVLVPNVAED